EVEQGQQRPEQIAANQLDIDVDPVRAGGFQPAGEVGLAAVEADVEAELLADIAALVGAARDADHPAAGDPGELAGDGTDRTACRADHDGLARLDLRDRM